MLFNIIRLGINKLQQVWNFLRFIEEIIVLWSFLIFDKYSFTIFLLHMQIILNRYKKIRWLGCFSQRHLSFNVQSRVLSTLSTEYLF